MGLEKGTANHKRVAKRSSLPEKVARDGEADGSGSQSDRNENSGAGPNQGNSGEPARISGDLS